MELEDAVKKALHNSIFLQQVFACFRLPTSGGFLSFVDEEGPMYCGNIAERVIPKQMLTFEMKQKQPTFQDYASAAEQNLERYASGYLSTHGNLIGASGFVLLSRWNSFANTPNQEANLRKRLQARGLDPDVWMHVTGGLPCVEDFVLLNTLRGCYDHVAFIKGYRLPCKQDIFFTVYQQHEAMELNELKEIIKMDAQPDTFLSGLRRLYYQKLIGTCSADGKVYLRKELRKTDAQISS